MKHTPDANTPDTDFAFDGDLSAGARPEVKTFDEAKQFARKLEQERDEADRRAGAAERALQYEKESRERRVFWLDKAKAEWGADRNVSFDTVWDECLALKSEVEQLRKVVDELARQLQPFSDPEKWDIAIASGRVGSAEDGEQMTVFSGVSPDPHIACREALEEYNNLPHIKSKGTK